jgi:hypothetical protein
VEDRRLPQPHASKAAGASDSALSSNLTALDSSGPSQTLFQWQNSMSYLNKRNVAVFERRVVMDHLSGSKMAYAKELLASANLDPEQLARIKSRQAHMSSDNLTVQFDRQAGGMRAAAVAATPLSRVTRLKTFQATGQVLLELDEGKQTVTGTLVSYDDDSGDVLVTGSPGSPPQVMEQDEKTGKWLMHRAQPGKPIQWNQRTGIARSEGGSVVGTSK